ncbi:carbohydrate ABC transporter permease [Amygdalobacter nucleatus]|uniref:ABC transporter, permease protein n=1 Tax=Amygdalobacter nucleatus TaxID=3029274 RepID=A0A133YHK1_9FIRM|nr:carbohydrate ABC transporter permease [Amygdalobacter nucleatus]KXB42674.1 ABC transporter, permease protein [Amygdalobacter nucleatus]MDF0486260.1 carbohydrate ABC transporter permease [Amygdalobacter nucleatus]WEG37181.1 carbohydrate ABC transporter permease [Amygdalobacter nucleatus]
MRETRAKIWLNLATVFFSLLSIVYIYPIVLVILNSLKKETAISTATTFELPQAATFAGISNYIKAVYSQGFLESLGYSTFITISSVALILICCSMCAWYITRVKGFISQLIYLLCAFSMVVPFQMVMFTLSQTADKLSIFGLRFNTPWTICFIYLGFGAGLAVFLFAGFMKSVPIEIEEAAMIDGCNPCQTYFKVVLPILKPTMISVGILETMWIWNDYLLPNLVLDIRKYRTIPMLVQYFRGSYGKVELGPMMASIVLTIIPVIVLYLLGQKYIIKGVLSGAVKG